MVSMVSTVRIRAFVTTYSDERLFEQERRVNGLWRRHRVTGREQADTKVLYRFNERCLSLCDAVAN